MARVGARPAWDIRPRRAPVVRALVAAVALAVAGALLGGAIGWLAFLFFSVASVALIAQLVGRRPVIELDERGVTVAAGPDRVQLVGWDEVEAILLWTRGPRGPSRVDMFSVVTTADLPGLASSLAPPPAEGDGLPEESSTSTDVPPTGDVPPPASDPPSAATGAGSPDPGGAGGGGRVDPERALRVAAPLRDCRVDAYELRAALLRFSTRVAVVDRRA